MATEKDIREFIQQNKIRIPKDDKFMEDLLKQIELLPTPATLQPKESNTFNRDERLEIIRQIAIALKKHNRRTATSLLFGIMLIGLAICALVYILGYTSVATMIPAQYMTYVNTFIYVLGALAILAVIRNLYRKTEFI